MILVDASVWIDDFNGIASPQTDRLDGLLGIAIGDIVLTEVLQGFADDRAFERAREAREALHLIEIAGPVVARSRPRGTTVACASGASRSAGPSPR